MEKKSFHCSYLTSKEFSMNRTSFLAALAATVLCFALTACGGGGGDSSTQSTGDQSSSSGSGDTSGTGGKATGGTGDNPGSPGDGSLGTIPNCTPQNTIIVTMLGDDTMAMLFYSVELQKIMDTHFGSGHVQISLYNTGAAGVDSSLYLSGDVILVSYGMWDMIAAESFDHYMAGLVNTHATLLVTQDPIISPFYDDTAYVQATKDVGVSMGIDVADVNGYVKAQPNWQSWLKSDGVYLTPEAIINVVDNVVGPALQKQVAPLRCLTS